MARSKLKVRLITPWGSRVETENAVFDAALPAEDADALLSYWGPSEELFTFPRRKAWYSTEPPCQFTFVDGGTWPSIRKRLKDHEFLWYNHPDDRFRIPEETHARRLTVDHSSDRQEKAVAVVSNFGGSVLRRLKYRDLQVRNRIITSPLVDLYGRSSWNQYRSGFLSRAKAPPNYRGEIPGDWNTDEKRKLLAGYKVNICMENMPVAGLFSEKFVEAVCCGCIPIFHAHPSIRTTVLEGATWVDPAEFNFDPALTIAAALTADRVSIAQTNEEWLQTNTALQQTHQREIYRRLGEALKQTESP